jgi:hypothetical protein
MPETPDAMPRAEVNGNSAHFDVKLDHETLADKDPATMLFHMDCCFELTCTLAVDFHKTKGELAAFKKGNAVFHSWPYLRGSCRAQRRGWASTNP